MPVDGWLSLLENPPPRLVFPRRLFPSDTARDEYLATIHRRTEGEVFSLLWRFLFQTGTSEFLDGMWVLKLLPDHPRLALQAMEAFQYAHMTLFYDDKVIWGWGDAEQLIRARYIGSPETCDDAIKLLFREGPRTFECLVERLYNAMGYKTELTAPQKDGGREVIAWKEDPGHQQHLLVECKLHTDPVGVGIPRALLGVVSAEKVNKGVVVSTARFTKGSRQFAGQNPRLELIDGPKLIPLMNEHLGARWALRINFLVGEAEKRSAKK
jgi:restriction system protein